jgi:glutamyl-Q tRNA(Asp) synthetase
MQKFYRGRFAPSPSGPLHFGSLLTAVGSYLEARVHGGEWLVRIEDIDTPRTVPGAADEILRALEAAGMHWDGSVIYQSTRRDAYDAALHEIRRRGHLYGCICSRREIADSAIAGIDGYVYSGTCRSGIPESSAVRAWRVKTQSTRMAFDDAIQGHIEQDLQRDIGDFVLLRADGLYAYQLAVVVDDAEQGITHVVRGADLLDSTPRQIHLQKLLGLRTPQYAHLAVAVNAQGQKLSKQTRARAVDISNIAPSLLDALRVLGQTPPSALRTASVNNIWTWALKHWRLEAVPRVRAVTSPAS